MLFIIGQNEKKDINLIQYNMKKLVFMFLMILLISCNGQKTGNKNLIASNPYLMGKWTGEGRFLNTSFSAEFGTVMFEIEIKEDNTISGKVGDAQLTKTSITRASYGFEIKGILDSKLKKDMDFKKKHLIILLVIPPESNIVVNLSDANFHVKNNYFFDINMRVGGVILTKEP